MRTIAAVLYVNAQPMDAAYILIFLLLLDKARAGARFSQRETVLHVLGQRLHPYHPCRWESSVSFDALWIPVPLYLQTYSVRGVFGK